MNYYLLALAVVFLFFSCVVVVILLWLRKQLKELDTTKKGVENMLVLKPYIKTLEERMAALEDAREGAQRFASKGVEAREQYQNRRQQAIMEGYKAYQEGKPPQEIVPNLLKSYPDVAAQYALNPMLLLQDTKKLGITLPPDFLAQLANTKKEPEMWYGLQL